MPSNDLLDGNFSSGAANDDIINKVKNLLATQSAVPLHDAYFEPVRPALVKLKYLCPCKNFRIMFMFMVLPIYCSGDEIFHSE